MRLRDGVQVPVAVRSKLTRRLLFLLFILIALSVAYAAAYVPLINVTTSVNVSASNFVQRAFGAPVDILFQLLIVFSIATFLSLLAPKANDLDTPDMRRYVIGPLTVRVSHDSHSASTPTASSAQVPLKFRRRVHPRYCRPSARPSSPSQTFAR